jgi:hypothetical protein
MRVNFATPQLLPAGAFALLASNTYRNRFLFSARHMRSARLKPLNRTPASEKKITKHFCIGLGEPKPACFRAGDFVQGDSGRHAQVDLA